MKKTFATLLFALLAIVVNAQMADPVKFSAQLKTGNTAEAEIVFTGKIDAGWHVYSTNLGDDGPISATFNVDKKDGVELVGKLTPRGKEINQFDNMFGMTLRYFENSVQFVQKVKFTKPSYSISGYLEYGACNDETCLPPTAVDFSYTGKSPAVAAETKAADNEKVADASQKSLNEDAKEPLSEGEIGSLAMQKDTFDNAKEALSQTQPMTEADVKGGSL